MLSRIGVLAIFLCSFPALTWFDVGHEVVGEIAWRSLDSQTKDKVSDLLKQLSPMYEEAASLATSGKLPDHMRTGFKIFDSWHYINLPYVEIPVTPPAPSTPNAVWALCEGVRTIATPKPKNANDPFRWEPKPFERAFMLPFLVHIAGDLHQPLHAISRHTAVNPEGDKSGLLFPIKLGDTVSNLHLYWDSGLGLFSDLREKPVIVSTKSAQTDELATRIMIEHPRTSFKDKVENVSFAEWAQESYNFAKSVTYNIREGTQPTKEYIAQGQKLVKERVALAGYRLAYLLTSLLSDKPSELATGCAF